MLVPFSSVSNRLAAIDGALIRSYRQRGAIPLAAANLARPVAGSALPHFHRPFDTGEMMFQKFITVFIVTAAIAFAASGLPLSSIFGAGSGSGFFNLPLIF
jgi:hypothetical protein